MDEAESCSWEMSNHQVVKVRRETIAACITCPLCNKLLKAATTISECLHTFCKKCIYDKLSDDELECYCCPICNIDLGCAPLEKLRPDHNLQDVRDKIFPLRRRKAKAPEVVPHVTLPVRRKERSLSSLVVTTPRVSTQTGTTGRRTKSLMRNAASLRASGFSVKKEEHYVDERLNGSSSPTETLDQFTHNIRQSSSNAEPSRKLASNKDTKNFDGPPEGKADLWKPLNCLVEVANRSKSVKVNSQGSVAKSESMHASEGEPQTHKPKVKKQKSKDQEKNNDSGPIKPRKRRVRRKREASSEEIAILPQALVDAASARCEKRCGPVWFSLLASEEQEGDAPLPQVPSSFLRIKDGSLTVSCIQKYLMKKLNLTNEAEVEIKCMGQSVLPTLQLHNLVDLWLQSVSTSERVEATLGSSARDFVMVLAYSRKVKDP